ncbi:hypothetical protein N9L06_00200 [Mariniblastus sp.]|nr:hypothetical protein [Mariniblastus sp.]
MMKAKVGDKIRIKSIGRRGVVERVQGKSLVVSFEDGKSASFDESEVTNFSLAARKAWERMPDRRVGRPKGTTRTDRTSVTLRIDRELWEQFRLAESQGKITDRTATINEWIAEKLNELES